MWRMRHGAIFMHIAGDTKIDMKWLTHEFDINKKNLMREQK